LLALLLASWRRTSAFTTEFEGGGSLRGKVAKGWNEYMFRALLRMRRILPDLLYSTSFDWSVVHGFVMFMSSTFHSQPDPNMLQSVMGAFHKSAETQRQVTVD
jgi:hypothetical protein